VDLTGAGLVPASVVELAAWLLVMIVRVAHHVFIMGLINLFVIATHHSFKSFLFLPFPLAIFYRESIHV
jgi:hypothetical protein